MIMMIGLPGSGKSYYAEKLAKETGYDIISTDRIRKEYFDDENDTSHNDEVWNIAHQKMNETDDYILDATNISRKDRNRHKSQHKGKRIAYVILRSIDDCIFADSLRERTVGRAAIIKMASRFCMPEKSEFDEIHIIRNSEDISYDEWFNRTINFAQTGKYHLETLDTHIKMAYSLADDDVKELAKWHDFGKLYTRTHNAFGYHFYGHANVSQYIYICSNNEYDEELAKLILYHDAIHYSKKLHTKVTTEMYDKLVRFSYADKLGAIKEKGDENMGHVFDFTPNSFKVKIFSTGEVVEFTYTPPDEFDYDIIKKIWEG